MVIFMSSDSPGPHLKRIRSCIKKVTCSPFGKQVTIEQAGFIQTGRTVISFTFT